MQRIVLVLLILLLTIGSLSSGAVVDKGLGSLYLDAGIGYPLGITDSATAEGKDVFVDIITLKADGSQASALSENFDIKV
jgi:hypothetical protein